MRKLTSQQVELKKKKKEEKEIIEELKLTFLQTHRDWLHDFSGGGRDIDIREIVLHGFQEEEIDFPGLVTLRLFETVAIRVQLRLRSYHFDAVLLPECRL